MILTKHQSPADDYWTLDAKPGDMEVNGRVIPYAFSLGTINPGGKINVWTPAASGVPRGYKKAAKDKLEAAVVHLRKDGLAK